LIASAGP